MKSKLINEPWLYEATEGNIPLREGKTPQSDFLTNTIFRWLLNAIFHSVAQWDESKTGFVKSKSGFSDSPMGLRVQNRTVNLESARLRLPIPRQAEFRRAKLLCRNVNTQPEPSEKRTLGKGKDSFVRKTDDRSEEERKEGNK